MDKVTKESYVFLLLFILGQVMRVAYIAGALFVGGVLITTVMRSLPSAQGLGFGLATMVFFVWIAFVGHEQMMHSFMKFLAGWDDDKQE